MNPINAPTRLQQAAKFRGDILDLGANTTVQCDTLVADNDLTTADDVTIGGDLGVLGSGGITAASVTGDITAGRDFIASTGAVSCSGAVTSTNGAIVGTGFNYQTSGISTVAAAGTTQGTATALTTALTHVSAADGTAGVILPTAAAGLVYVVYNLHATLALRVYPNTSDDIDDGTANVHIVLAPKKSAMFVAVDVTTWAMRGVNAATTFTQTYSTADATIAAPTAVTGTSTAGANGYSSAGEAAAIQTAINALVADDLDNRKAITSIIDALQAAGIVL